MQRTCARLAVLALAASAAVGVLAPPALGHGTINMLGQSAEHEKITRAASECDPKLKPPDAPGRCFEKESENQLAGTSTTVSGMRKPAVNLGGPAVLPNFPDITTLKVGTVGAVGSPDIESFFEDTPHCTAGDFLPGTYPRTRQDADDALLACHNLLIRHFRRGLDLSDRLVDAQARIVPGAVGLPCNPVDQSLALRGLRRFTRQLDAWKEAHVPGSEVLEALNPQFKALAALPGKLRSFISLTEHFYSAENTDTAKCRVIGELGKMLHGIQDFYSHGNWADSSDPSRAIGLTNPPGLAQSGRAPLMDMLVEVPVVHPGLVTACFAFLPGECSGRIDHDEGIGKDKGAISFTYAAALPNTVHASRPDTPRGQVATNFSDAIVGAVNESTGAWTDFGRELIVRYGAARGTQMICAITHDDPVRDCKVVVPVIETTVGPIVVTGGNPVPTPSGPSDGPVTQPMR